MRFAEIKIRNLRKDDAKDVSELSRYVPEAGNWDPSNYERLGELGLQGWVAELEGEIAGFLIARCAAAELEILSLATACEFRRRRVASALLAKCLEEAIQSGARNAFLEVRESNLAAITLYKGAGFRVSGKRVEYYRNPAEDAALMTCELPELKQIPIGT